MMDINAVIDLTYLMEAVIGLLIMLAMRYLIPWLKSRMTNEQEATLITLFDVACMAAEKIYGAKKGDEKLAYVERYLEARGIKLDTMRLKTYVNASIKKMEQASPIEFVTGEIGTATLIEEESKDEEDEEPQTEGTQEGA